MIKDRYVKLLNELGNDEDDYSRDRDDNVLVIDGLNNFLRVYAVNPSLNDDGDHVGGLVGFLNSIGYVLRTLRPTRCVIIFDGKGGSQRRRKIYPDYKENRRVRFRLNRNLNQTVEEEQRSMREQMFKLAEYMSILPITVMSMDNVEADDIIAYCATDIFKKNVTIMSTDKDFLQLVNNRVRVWNPIKKEMVDPKFINDKYEISSKNFIWYRVLDGDKSDNIPGIKGAGLKTIRKNIEILKEDKFITEEEFFNFIERKDKKHKIHTDILDHPEIIARNYKLMQLNDVDINGSTKSRVREIIHNFDTKLDIYEFKKLFIRDKLYSNIANVDLWLRKNFYSINSYN